MKLSKLLSILFLVVFSGANLLAQQSAYFLKNITIDDGLSQNSVVDITEDFSGFMWFATQDGLNRFDGTNFEVFPRAFDDITTPDNSQLGKLVAHNNKIWLISKGGKLEYLDIYTRKFVEVNSPTDVKEALPAISNILIDSRNEIWLSTLNDGIIHLSEDLQLLHTYKQEFTGPFKISNNRVRNLYEARNGEIWVLTDSGIDIIKHGKSQSRIKGFKANTISENSQGEIWIGTLGDGVLYKLKGALEFVHAKGWKDNPLPSDLVVEAIYADADNKIWIGTYGKGMYILDQDQQIVTHLEPDRSDPFALAFQDVLSIKADSNGGIWIGTDGGGVNYYSKQFNNFNSLTDYNVPHSIPIEQIRAITIDEDNILWIGTSGKGLTTYNAKTNQFNSYHFKPFKPGVNNYDRVVALWADKDDIYIGTHGNGLLVMNRFTGDIKTWYTTDANESKKKLPDNTIWCFLKEGNNKVWLGTRYAGLVLLDKKEGVVKEFSQGPRENVRSLFRISDSIIAVGYEKSGIRLLNTKNGQFRQVQQWEANNEIGIKSLYYQNDWLWAGTSGSGIYTYNLRTNAKCKFDQKDGLPNTMIYSILPGINNTLWISSNKGIFGLGYNSTAATVKLNSIKPFTKEDGLQSNEFNTGASFKSNSGFLYFGGIAGLNYFDPEKVDMGREEFSVVLTHAMIGNKALETDTLITYKQNLRLPYKKNSLSFDYTVLDYVSPGKMNYAYMLEGYDEEWIDAGTRNYTAYTNLPAGNYQFKVKISDKIIKSAPVTSLGIIIDKPFWLTWWFVFGILSLIAIFLFTMYRYRINRLLEVQRVKNDISADLHDDIGSRLTTIQFLSALSRDQLNGYTEAHTYLNDIDREVMASSEALDEIVWNIKITDESLEDIVAKMRRYAGEVLENDGIIYQIDARDSFIGKKMNMHKRRELFLVFKELVNNIRKHSQANAVIIRIAARMDMFYLYVEDDGKGFDPLAATGRNGILNIKHRVAKWNGRLVINSKINEGTRIEIWMPFDSRVGLKWFFQTLKR